MNRRAFALALIAAAAFGQDPLLTLPANYRLLLHNQFTRVIRVTYGPHEKLPLHNHSDKPTVYVYLNDCGPVRFSHVEEHPFTLVRPAEKLGTFRVSPGRIERHTVENLGDNPSEFLRVELTQVPLGFEGGSFRGNKPFDLAHSGITEEFTCPYVRIERVIAAGGRPTEVPAGSHPALLIAFSPATLKFTKASHTLRRGDVLWMNAHESAQVMNAGPSAAHLLQIVFTG